MDQKIGPSMEEEEKQKNKENPDVLENQENPDVLENPDILENK
jgi:hypothetical protein